MISSSEQSSIGVAKARSIFTYLAGLQPQGKTETVIGSEGVGRDEAAEKPGRWRIEN